MDIKEETSSFFFLHYFNDIIIRNKNEILYIIIHYFIILTCLLFVDNIYPKGGIILHKNKIMLNKKQEFILSNFIAFICVALMFYTQIITIGSK